MTPGGYLTINQGNLVVAGDLQSQKLWYAPDGRWARVPVFDGSAWQTVSFLASPMDQIGWELNLGGASTFPPGAYHVFATLTPNGYGLAVGSAWSTSAGAQAQWLRYDGIDVLASSMSLRYGPNAGDVFTCDAFKATWLGSILLATNGTLQVTSLKGQLRRWDVWNRHNKKPLHVRVIQPDTTGAGAINWVPTNNYPNFLPFNNNANNKATVFSGAEEDIDCQYSQSGFLDTRGGPAAIIAAIGWDSNAAAGHFGKASNDVTGLLMGLNARAWHVQKSAIGPHTVTMLCAMANTPGATFWSGDSRTDRPQECNQIMHVRWQG